MHEYNPPEIFFSSGIAKIKGLKNECRFDIASKLTEYAKITHGPYAIHKHTTDFICTSSVFFKLVRAVARGGTHAPDLFLSCHL